MFSHFGTTTTKNGRKELTFEISYIELVSRGIAYDTRKGPIGRLPSQLRSTLCIDKPTAIGTLGDHNQYILVSVVFLAEQSDDQIVRVDGFPTCRFRLDQFGNQRRDRRFSATAAWGTGSSPWSSAASTAKRSRR